MKNNSSNCKNSPSSEGSDKVCLTSKMRGGDRWRWMCESTDCDSYRSSLHRFVRLFHFFWFKGFRIRASNNSRLINSLCSIGANFTVDHATQPIIVRVNRTRSIFFYLLPNNIAGLIFKVLWPVPFSFLFNAKKNPTVS